jgi:uncharacterized protein YodC (DUF2158 family)
MTKQNAVAGQKLVDTAGRIGIVTEVRDHQYGGSGVFARPEDHEYKVQDKSGEKTGVKNSEIITATWWEVQADGSYEGKWWDDAVGSSNKHAHIQ